MFFLTILNHAAKLQINETILTIFLLKYERFIVNKFQAE